MKKKLILSSVLATAAVATPLVAITSCELDEEGTVSNKVTSVSIKGLGQIEAGTSTQFTANVRGKGEFDKNVTWSIKQEDSKCKIDEKTGMFTAGPDAEKCTIVATSVENPKVFDTFEVAAIYVVRSVSVRATSTNREYGQAEIRLYSSVDATPGCDTSVEFSIDEPSYGCRLVESQGKTYLGTYSWDEPATNYVTVRATSKYDPSKSGTLTFTVTSKIKGISVYCDKTETTINGSAQFTANVDRTAGLSDNVTWEISKDEDETGSKINAETGVFTAGNKVGSVTVKATSLVDPEISGEYTIKLIPDFTYRIESWTNTAILTKYVGEAKTFTIPSVVYDGGKEYPVVEIDQECFINNQTLEEIVFSPKNNVTFIDQYAFYGVSKLKQITIPDNVTYIGIGALEYCSALKKVVFNKTSQLTTLGDQAFSHCNSLESISIPSGITVLQAHLFAWSEGLKVVTLAAKITEIAYRCFYYATGLRCINFPGTVDEWNAITRSGSGIFYQVPNDAYAQCSDGGRVLLNPPKP